MNHAEYLARHAPEKSLPHYGKSFSWAAKLLPSKTRAAVTHLYAFCRAIDDIADESNDHKAAIIRLNQIHLALGMNDTSDPLANHYLLLCKHHGLATSVAQRFIQSVIDDCKPLQIQSNEELIRYCFGVAGTVGLMMCPLLGVTAKAAYMNAAALGIGMQMTNIARDVIEDAARQRCYVPASSLPGHFDLKAISDADSNAIHAIFPAIKQLIGHSEAWYLLGEKGFPAIPFATRQSIKAASRIYHKIGERIVSMDADNYRQQRVMTTGYQKLSAALTASFKPFQTTSNENFDYVLRDELQRLGLS